jgi:hypothetical protein
MFDIRGILILDINVINSINSVNAPTRAINIFIRGINDSTDIILNNSPIVFAPALYDKIMSHMTDIAIGHQ